MLFIDPTYYGAHNNSINFVNVAQLKIMKVEYYSFSKRSFHAYTVLSACTINFSQGYLHVHVYNY